MARYRGHEPELLLRDSPGELTTWNGFHFRVRLARRDDEAQVSELFGRLSPEDRWLRFLTGTPSVGQDMVSRLSRSDERRTRTFLVFDGDTLIASAMLAEMPENGRAEAAVSVLPDHKGRGVASALLAHLADVAEQEGMRLIQCVERRDNVESVRLEQQLGFIATVYPPDHSLVVLTKYLG